MNYPGIPNAAGGRQRGPHTRPAPPRPCPPAVAVDPAQVCTQPCLLKSFDIKTMTKEDAAFTAPFRLTATRNDYVHAFVAYFDVAFNDCHKPVGFSTAPRCR